MCIRDRWYIDKGKHLCFRKNCSDFLECFHLILISIVLSRDLIGCTYMHVILDMFGMELTNYFIIYYCYSTVVRLFFPSGGGTFVITFTFLGSAWTLLLDIVSYSVRKLLQNFGKHVFWIQVTFICIQVLKTLSCISFVLSQVRMKWEMKYCEIFWIFWNNSSTLTNCILQKQ